MTTKSKHTPGPWKLGGQAVSGITAGLIRIEGTEVVHTSGRNYPNRVSTISASNVVAFLNGDPNVSEVVAANARLIAKVPDMYGICQMIHAHKNELFHAIREGSPMRDWAVSVIKKVEDVLKELEEK